MMEISNNANNIKYECWQGEINEDDNNCPTEALLEEELLSWLISVNYNVMQIN